MLDAEWVGAVGIVGVDWVHCNYMGETIAARFGSWFAWEIRIQKNNQILGVSLFLGSLEGAVGRNGFRLFVGLDSF